MRHNLVRDSAKGWSASVSHRCAAGWDSGGINPTARCILIGPGRQPQRKCPACAGHACNAQVPAHRARQVAADGQAETHTFARIAEAPVELHERLENPFLLLWLDADAAVLDFDVEPGLSVDASQDDGPPGVRELQAAFWRLNPSTGERGGRGGRRASAVEAVLAPLVATDQNRSWLGPPKKRVFTTLL